jgi:hypothetical protein
MSSNRVFGWCWGSGAITNKGQLLWCEASSAQYASLDHPKGMKFATPSAFLIVEQVRRIIHIRMGKPENKNK